MIQSKNLPKSFPTRTEAPALGFSAVLGLAAGTTTARSEAITSRELSALVVKNSSCSTPAFVGLSSSGLAPLRPLGLWPQRGQGEEGEVRRPRPILLPRCLCWSDSEGPPTVRSCLTATTGWTLFPVESAGPIVLQAQTGLCRINRRFRT
jgi:hypothetical protein